MLGTIISPNPQCPKCGSYMFFPREKNHRRYYFCKVCGKKKYEKRKRNNWKVYLSRFMLWLRDEKIRR